MRLCDEDTVFTKTAPAAAVAGNSQDPHLREPAYYAMLLLKEFEDPSVVLQSTLLVGLAIRCACQIALDYRRLTIGGAHLMRSSSGGSISYLHSLRRRSAPFPDRSSRDAHPVHPAFNSMRSTTDASLLRDLEVRMMYITDSHVEDSGVRDGASHSAVCLHMSNLSSPRNQSLPLHATLECCQTAIT
jgi:hypothetical protein